MHVASFMKVGGGRLIKKFSTKERKKKKKEKKKRKKNKIKKKKESLVKVK